MGPEVAAFREKITPLVQDPDARIILGMAHVDYIDSTGLGALVVTSSAARKAKGAVKLLGMNTRNLELLVTTKLETIFEHYMDEQEAVNSFFPDRRVQKFDILSFVREHQKDE